MPGGSSTCEEAARIQGLRGDTPPGLRYLIRLGRGPGASASCGCKEGAGQHPGWTSWAFLTRDISCCPDQQRDPEGFLSSFSLLPGILFFLLVRWAASPVGPGGSWEQNRRGHRLDVPGLRGTPALACDDGHVAGLYVHPFNDVRIVPGSGAGTPQ